METGDYRIRLTGAGDDAVIYDSGTVSLADGGDYIIAATNNVAANSAKFTRYSASERR